MRRRAPWMTPAVKCLLKNKRDLWHKNHASWKIRSLVLEYKKCRQDVKRICRSTIRNYESKLASDKNNPKRLFSYINSKHGTKVKITSIRDGKGYTHVDGEKIANVINDQFSSVFVKVDVNLALPHFSDRIQKIGCIDSLKIAVEDSKNDPFRGSLRLFFRKNIVGSGQLRDTVAAIRQLDTNALLADIETDPHSSINRFMQAIQWINDEIKQLIRERQRLHSAVEHNLRDQLALRIVGLIATRKATFYREKYTRSKAGMWEHAKLRKPPTTFPPDPEYGERLNEQFSDTVWQGVTQASISRFIRPDALPFRFSTLPT
ncbi:RNA-directed DNA polymerase from mobile element jockey-like [Brachionus plicatilis]|uniref:RNA-directed DNA polymerase from mobile element jockey-like n=1 Tax=Brachionus plicatilis TaxID=10195 RepID=A0A3M7QMH4_BRAPC|nr:RNA-directed DNA polymerase from mobile element jockey-like [Brachionus plicatilis]